MGRGWALFTAHGGHCAPFSPPLRHGAMVVGVAVAVSEPQYTHGDAPLPLASYEAAGGCWRRGW